MRLTHPAGGLRAAGARLLALLALAGTAQAAQPPCTDADFEKFSLYDAAAMNTRIPAQELRRVFSEQFGLEMGALRRMNHTAFGTLLAVEPALAVLIGLIVLHQTPSAVQVM